MFLKIYIANGLKYKKLKVNALVVLSFFLFLPYCLVTLLTYYFIIFSNLCTSCYSAKLKYFVYLCGGWNHKKIKLLRSLPHPYRGGRVLSLTLSLPPAIFSRSFKHTTEQERVVWSFQFVGWSICLKILSFFGFQAIISS